MNSISPPAIAQPGLRPHQGRSVSPSRCPGLAVQSAEQRAHAGHRDASPCPATASKGCRGPRSAAPGWAGSRGSNHTDSRTTGRRVHCSSPALPHWPARGSHTCRGPAGQHAFLGTSLPRSTAAFTLGASQASFKAHTGKRICRLVQNPQRLSQSDERTRVRQTTRLLSREPLRVCGSCRETGLC